LNQHVYTDVSSGSESDEDEEGTGKSEQVKVKWEHTSFEVGRFCAFRTKMWHQFHHWKFFTYRKIFFKLNSIREKNQEIRSRHDLFQAFVKDEERWRNRVFNEYQSLIKTSEASYTDEGDLGDGIALFDSSMICKPLQIDQKGGSLALHMLIGEMKAYISAQNDTDEEDSSSGESDSRSSSHDRPRPKRRSERLEDSTAIIIHQSRSDVTMWFEDEDKSDDEKIPSPMQHSGEESEENSCTLSMNPVNVVDYMSPDEDEAARDRDRVEDRRNRVQAAVASPPPLTPRKKRQRVLEDAGSSSSSVVSISSDSSNSSEDDSSDTEDGGKSDKKKKKKT
jgi:hypothetical protein